MKFYISKSSELWHGDGWGYLVSPADEGCVEIAYFEYQGTEKKKHSSVTIVHDAIPQLRILLQEQIDLEDEARREADS